MSIASIENNPYKQKVEKALQDLRNNICGKAVYVINILRDNPIVKTIITDVYMGRGYFMYVTREGDHTEDALYGSYKEAEQHYLEVWGKEDE